MRYGLLLFSVIGTAMLLTGRAGQGWPGVDVLIGMNIFSWVVTIVLWVLVDCSARAKR